MLLHQTSASGIQWCDVREGSGATPARGAVIRCHYTGRLASNNAVFDSSYERGRPLSFKIGVREVIAGWCGRNWATGLTYTPPNTDTCCFRLSWDYFCY